MLKRWLAKLFGVQGEIDDLRRQVAELSWDEPFGMWTRGAFLKLCEAMPREDRPIAFIDLNGIGELNLLHGYTEVDRRIRTTFTFAREPGSLVARWYSGDEIVIVFDRRQDPHRMLARLRESARKNDLTFIAALGEWGPRDEPVAAVIDRLSQETCSLKRSVRPRYISGGADVPREYPVGSLNRPPQPENLF